MLPEYEALLQDPSSSDDEYRRPQRDAAKQRVYQEDDSDYEDEVDAVPSDEEEEEDIEEEGSSDEPEAGPSYKPPDKKGWKSGYIKFDTLVRLKYNKIGELQQNPPGFYECFVGKQVPGKKQRYVRLTNGDEMQVGAKALAKTGGRVKVPPRKVQRTGGQQVEVLSDNEVDDNATPAEIWGPPVPVTEQTWTRVDKIRECPRKAKHLDYSGGYQGEHPHSDNPIDHFLRFFPYTIFQALLGKMQENFSRRWPKSSLQLDTSLMFKFLGLLLRMAVYQLPSEMYWMQDTDNEFPEFHFRKHMSFQNFKRVWAVWLYPGYTYESTEGGEAPDIEITEGGAMNLSYIEEGFGKVSGLLQACVSQWQKVWKCSSQIVVDETMIAWQGAAEGHISKLPRKPKSTGVQIKTTACESSGVLLNAEFCDAKERMVLKKYFPEFGATTGCTLRLTEPWQQTGREVIGDAWFGSLRTCLALRDVGLYSILNVKTGHKGFPKKQIKETLKVRDDEVHFVAHIPSSDRPGAEIWPIYASGHMDKQPMLLVHSSRSSLPGKARLRRWRKVAEGRYLSKIYILEQPECHAAYRNGYARIDTYNKLSVGPYSLTEAIRTRDWDKKFFLAFLAFCETNAYLAYKFECQNARRKPMSHLRWKLALGIQLLRFESRVPRIIQSAETPAHPIQVHYKVTRTASGSTAKCAVCRVRTHYECGCGKHICSPLAKGQECWIKHLSSFLKPADWSELGVFL